MASETKPNYSQPEMHEGKQAFDAFRRAAKRILSLKKEALPPDPFGSRKQKKKKANQC